MITKRRSHILIFILVLVSHLLVAQKQLELGTVKWLRNLDEGKKVAMAQHKPIFLLFQEVPGCSTCRNFGEAVLSHPLIVEAISTYFVPVAIFNNKNGHDAEVLAAYKEPAWNNPVIRIVDEGGKARGPRHGGQSQPAPVAKTINSALIKSNRLIPEYLVLLETELNADPAELYLEMYCFWSGEKNIGAQPGVIYTEPGFSNGKEVVRVVFDDTATSAEKVAAQARKSGNADAIHIKNGTSPVSVEGIRQAPLKNYTVDKDLHYYLKNSEYAALPLSPIQATRINSALGNGTSPTIYLSPLQQQMLKDIKAGKLAKKVRYTAKPWYASWPESF